MCAGAACHTAPAPSDDAVGGGDVDDDGRTRPGGPGVVGEGFAAEDIDPAAAAAKKKAAREARDKRWAALASSLRKADAKTLFERAQEQEKSQNWKNAEDAYEAVVVFFPDDKNAAQAVDKAMRMAFRRGEYGEGFQFFEDALSAFEGDAKRVTRARLLRVLASTELAVPHWGTTRGGDYLRGRYDQGKQTQTYAEDRASAIAHLEEARALLAADPTAKKQERAAVDVDAALAVARFTGFDPTWSWWWYPGNGPDDGLADAEGEDEQADQWRDTSWYGDLQRAKPRGIPVSPTGEVLFTQKPKAYGARLDDTGKIKFLLDEAQALDDDPKKEIAGAALLQQALLFRTRDGGERLDRLRNWWWAGSYPYKDVAKDEEMFKLGDDEVLTLVATGVRKVTVPADESVPKLLAAVQRLYPQAKAAEEASSLLGTYWQSREQYPKARETYEAYLRDHADGAHRGEVQANLDQLKRAEIVFQAKGPQAAGKNATVSLRFRNTDGAVFKATRIDAEKLLAEFEKAWKPGVHRRTSDDREIEPSNMGWAFVQYYGAGEDYYRTRRFLTKDVVTFEGALHPDKDMRYADEDVKTPLDKPGVWLVEVRAKGAGRGDAPMAQTLVVVEKASIVMKNAAQGEIAWVVDSKTGKPIPKAAVDVFFYGSRWEKDHEIRMSKKATVTTDEHGVAVLPKSGEMTALVSTHVGGAFTVPVQQWLGWQYYRTQTAEDERVAVVVTDRPIYRPGDTVKVAVFARHKKGGTYLPATDAKNIEARINDSRGTELLVKTVPASQFGSMTFELPLKKDASLGQYAMQIRIDGNYADAAGAAFRVEEYKAPEVQVSVKSAGQARLGDKIPVQIHADYYSGGPVDGAKVKYKVFRQDHEVEYAAPTPWDWLYGAGYGRIWYRYAWFPWWSEYGPHPIIWYPWWGPKPEPNKELVLEGEGVTDAAGVLSLTVDSSPARRDLGDRDHQYTVEAEVTDLSRHVVKGTGEVVVTRTAFLASLELQAGWARAGDDVDMVISTLLPDGSLFPVNGKVRIEEVVSVAENGAVRVDREKPVEEKPLSTDQNGPSRLRWRAPHTGQYKFTFVAKDKDGVEVKSSAVAWVVGPEFVGEKYRFAGVEIIPDKRTYQPGETARLMVSADRAGASVMLATKVDNGALVDWKVIELPNKTTIVELPITKEHQPNFFVEALTVADAQLFEEAREMFVPPAGSALNVVVKPSAGELQPGAKGTVSVTTTDADGKPVPAEVVLSIFDSAILAIAPDNLADVRTHLWGRKRTHQPQSSSSLGREQAVWGGLSSPDQQARWQLASRSQQRFQGEIDFARLDQNEGSVLGGDMLAADDAKDSTGVGGLGLRGAGAGGGGKLAAKSAHADRRSREDRDEAAAAEAPAPSTPMAQAVGRAAASGTLADKNAEYRATGGEAQKKNGAAAFEPKVRSNFADTAVFTVVTTDKNGKAVVPVTYPENTTTWKIKAVGLDADTRAGRGDASVITSKKLLVRLAAPRFFRERDTLLLSGLVQNKYPQKRSVSVTLDVTDDLLAISGSKTRAIDVPSNGEVRVDFEVKVRGEGAAKVRLTARGDTDGDAKELTFPVLVHGMEKTVANVGSISAGAQGKAEKSIVIEVPKERREDETDLIVRTSPSLAGGMIDALPYLVDYPYGCVEQTLSRFVPAALTKKALQQAGGVKLEDLAKAHRDLNAQHLNTGHGSKDAGAFDKQRIDDEMRPLGRPDRNPIYDSEVLDGVIAEGLKRIQKMQHGDGGWGWWSDDGSSVYMTSLVLAGLLDAREADLHVDESMLQRGRAALRQEVESEIWRYRRAEDRKYVSDSDAYALWVMSRFKDRHDELQKLLYERRAQLTPYGKLLLALANKNLGQEGNARLLLENVEQFRKEDKENETTWIETNTTGWWYWWNDDIETNALYLRALDQIRAKEPAALATGAGVVKWLLNHRKHGWYWDSTRDTSQVIAAFANHMQVSGERRPDYDLEILVDGAVKKKVHVDAKNMFTVDTDLYLSGREVTGGKHTITVRRTGEGAVYFNSYLSFFTTEDDIKATGLEVKVERKYYKLARQDRVHDVAGDRGQSLAQTELAYRKVPLSSGDTVKSGDLILVELLVTSKNDYTFLAFEDPKPAGAEAVAQRSGNVFGETWAHMELRDDRVVFFLSELTQGSLKLSYRLRAEIPGTFSAMPTRGFAMYAPEIRANSDEMKLRIVE